MPQLVGPSSYHSNRTNAERRRGARRHTGGPRLSAGKSSQNRHFTTILTERRSNLSVPYPHPCLVPTTASSAPAAAKHS